MLELELGHIFNFFVPEAKPLLRCLLIFSTFFTRVGLSGVSDIESLTFKFGVRLTVEVRLCLLEVILLLAIFASPAPILLLSPSSVNVRDRDTPGFLGGGDFIFCDLGLQRGERPPVGFFALVGLGLEGPEVTSGGGSWFSASTVRHQEWRRTRWPRLRGSLGDAGVLGGPCLPSPNLGPLTPPLVPPSLSTISLFDEREGSGRGV